MGKVVMPKNSAVESEIKAALKIYYDSGDWMKNDEFTTKLKDLIGGDQYHSSYTKKVQMTSYFGFTTWENYSNSQSRRKITETGKRFYEAWENDDKDAMLEEIMLSLEHTVFGRNNCGCSDSDSDIEIPSLFIRTLIELDYLLYNEFAYMLWRMEDCAVNYTDALNELKEVRTNGTLSLNEDAKRYTDAKPIAMLIRWGFLAENGKIGNSTKIVLSDDVSKKYMARLRNLKIYNVDKNLVDTETSCIQQRNSFISNNDQKKKFKIWMTTQKKQNGDPYSENTINSYISQMEHGYSEFKKYKTYNSVFEIQDVSSIEEYMEYLFNEPNFDAFNLKAGNKACSCGLVKYKEFLSEKSPVKKINFNTTCKTSFSCNRIIFGAPGTGKSHTLNEETEKLIKDMNGEYERVTFHPDYSYANFVGTYKPVPTIDNDGKESITYKYVPGPFMRVLKKALENANTPGATPRPFVLVIEEINRANVAAVFGDVFQLLDRDESNCSEYKIEASEDLKKHLADELHCSMEAVSELKIPNNMFIWATMNSADQGVFPMDTAFKRRWDFTYLGIDNGDDKISGKTVTLGKGDYKRVVEWNKLRKAINGVLSSKDFKINEDKLRE